MADFLVALAEFDRRRGWASLGYSSLFWFLHRELKLSKGAALYRKTAAELIEAHPQVVDPLRDGRLCLSTVFEVAKVLTSDNASTVLPRFFHLSRKEAADVAAAIRPVQDPPHRTVLTTIAMPRPVEPAVRADHDSGVMVHPVDRNPRDESPGSEGSRQPSLAVPPLSPSVIVALDAELRRLHITVSRRLLAKIDLARDALSHSHPSASMEAVLEAGLDLLIERHRKRRGVGAVAAGKPRRAAPERITAEVMRRVWERDGGRCQWPLEGGGVCSSTLRLEFDHRVPRGLGGSSGLDNVRLLCRFHNQRAARIVYGDEHVDGFIVGSPTARETCPAYGSPAPTPAHGATATPAGGTSRSPASPPLPGRPPSPWRPGRSRRRHARSPPPGWRAPPRHPG